MYVSLRVPDSLEPNISVWSLAHLPSLEPARVTFLSSESAVCLHARLFFLTCPRRIYITMHQICTNTPGSGLQTKFNGNDRSAIGCPAVHRRAHFVPEPKTQYLILLFMMLLSVKLCDVWDWNSGLWCEL